MKQRPKYLSCLCAIAVNYFNSLYHLKPTVLGEGLCQKRLNVLISARPLLLPTVFSRGRKYHRGVWELCFFLPLNHMSYALPSLPLAQPGPGEPAWFCSQCPKPKAVPLNWSGLFCPSSGLPSKHLRQAPHNQEWGLSWSDCWTRKWNGGSQSLSTPAAHSGIEGGAESLHFQGGWTVQNILVPLPSASLCVGEGWR